MKKTWILLLFAAYVAQACSNSQSEAKSHAAAIQQLVEKHTPGSVATLPGGYFMEATINGKPWAASHMLPDMDERSNYKNIRGEVNGDAITFRLWKQRTEPGKSAAFSETNNATYFLAAASEIFSGQTGAVEITRLDNEWLEGRFHFTGISTASKEKVEVTDGRFRVASGLAQQ
jgi:hypothetical protein